MAFYVDDYGPWAVNRVNLSTNVEKSATAKIARVLCPVSFRFAQGPRRLSETLCICTGERCVHPVHLFTKLGTCPLTKSGGFPTPQVAEIVWGPNRDWDLVAGGVPFTGEWGR